MSSSYYIIGVKHCGKSSVGRDLADSLKIPCYDLDHLIEKSVNMTVRDFYKKNGKQEFQRVETEALLLLQQKKTNFICATGGGICDNPEAYKILKRTKNIYINVNFETVYSRIVKNGVPAFLKSDDPKAEFLTMYTSRTELYKTLGTVEIDGNNRTQHQISNELQSKLEEL